MLYMEISKLLLSEILSQKYLPGSRLPSIRTMAKIYNVNPNTIHKTLKALKKDGYVYSNSTRGNYVTLDQDRIIKAKKTILCHESIEYLKKINDVGYSLDEAIEILIKIKSKGNMN